MFNNRINKFLLFSRNKKGLILENNKNLIIIPDETNNKRPNTDPYIV